MRRMLGISAFSVSVLLSGEGAAMAARPLLGKPAPAPTTGLCDYIIIAPVEQVTDSQLELAEQEARAKSKAECISTLALHHRGRGRTERAHHLAQLGASLPNSGPMSRAVNELTTQFQRLAMHHTSDGSPGPCEFSLLRDSAGAAGHLQATRRPGAAKLAVELLESTAQVCVDDGRVLLSSYDAIAPDALKDQPEAPKGGDTGVHTALRRYQYQKGDRRLWPELSTLGLTGVVLASGFHNELDNLESFPPALLAARARFLLKRTLAGAADCLREQRNACTLAARALLRSHVHSDDWQFGVLLDDLKLLGDAGGLHDLPTLRLAAFSAQPSRGVATLGPRTLAQVDQVLSLLGRSPTTKDASAPAASKPADQLYGTLLKLQLQVRRIFGEVTEGPCQRTEKLHAALNQAQGALSGQELARWQKPVEAIAGECVEQAALCRQQEHAPDQTVIATFCQDLTDKLARGTDPFFPSLSFSPEVITH